MNTLATNTYSSFLDHTATSLDMLEITETVAEREKRGHKASDTSHKRFTSNHLPSVPAHAIFTPQLSQRGREMMQLSSKVNHFF